MKLLVRNLSRNTSEETLRTLFTQHGSVQSCHIVMDKDSKQSKGFGFIDMPKVSEAKAALSKLNYLLLDGNKLRVKKVEKEQNGSEEKDG